MVHNFIILRETCLFSLLRLVLQEIWITLQLRFNEFCAFITEAISKVMHMIFF